MHRQSLGSPSSKLHSHIHGGPKEDCLEIEESTRRRDSISSSIHADYNEDNEKSTKPHHSPLILKPDKLIHLIPILVILCFFILYLFSRTPSNSDLAQFNGFKRAAKHTAVAELNDITQYMVEAGRGGGDTVAIRSPRNLQEIAARQRPKSRPHRKFADF